MNPTRHLIRPAAEADIESIVRIWHEGWLDGHLGHVPDVLGEQRNPEDFSTRCRARLPEFQVATVADTVAGLVVVAGSEVEQIYVDREHRGTGVANMLLNHAEHMVYSAGYPRAWLAVVEGNRRAQRFYRRNGWRDTGALVYAAALGEATADVATRRFEKLVRDSGEGDA